MYWSMVINFLTVLITCVTCKTAPTFVEIPAYSTLFKTDQYLFVGINHCTLYTQRAVPARTCPYYAVYQSRKVAEEHCPGMKMHLILTENEKPLALILKPSETYGLLARAVPIPWPYRPTSPAFTGNTTSTEGAYTVVTNAVFYSEIAASFFDNDYRILYILKNNTVGEHIILECYLFYVNVTKDGRLTFTDFGVISDVHKSNHRRFLWTEDPYSSKFYYVEKRDDGRMVLCSLPFRSIMQTLIDGKPGTSVYLFHGERLYVSVSHDVLITYAYKDGRVAQFTKNLAGLEDAIICYGRYEPDMGYDLSTALTVIFDKDYCQLEAEMQMLKCVANKWYEEKKEGPSQPLYTQQWFLTCIVLFVMVTVVLIIALCRCCHQDALDRTLSNGLRRHFPYPYLDQTNYSFD